jgi:large subunit ribosomal protein L21
VYAVLETGGKQYKVNIGQIIEVEKLAGEAGDTIELDRVLMVSDGDGVKVGTPLVDGAKVSATVLDQKLGRKVLIFKYVPKQRYRRKKGHRQHLTRLKIEDIIV